MILSFLLVYLYLLTHWFFYITYTTDIPAIYEILDKNTENKVCHPGLEEGNS